MSRRRPPSKELTKLEKELRPRGWTLVLTANHPRFVHPAHGFVVCAATCSDFRGIRNLRRNIRQAEAGRPIRH